jgi:carbamoyltransferase
MDDGQITHMASEERFVRKKNFSGFPKKTIGWILEDAGISGSDFDQLAFATRSATIVPDRPFKTWRHRGFATLSRWLPAVIGSDWFIRFGVEWMARRREQRLDHDALCELGVESLPRSFFDHHRTHAASAYYGSGFATKHDRTLVLTYDGSGDGLCATVSLVDEGKWHRLHAINGYHSLALLYTRVTQHLGMKPLEHEYKLMGMAPYADPNRAAAVGDVLLRYLKLSPDKLSTVNVSRSWGDSMLEKLHFDLRNHRFDSVAAGMQLHFEQLMLSWVLAWVEKSGVRNVVVAGGAFMNVKLNMLIAHHPSIDDFFVLPACGDESVALGAAYLMTEELAPGTSKPIGSLCLGCEVNERQIQVALQRYNGRIGYRKCDDIESEVATLLAKGKIIGRCRGRMEWGARALGNRSILSSPESMQAVHRINKAVKKRDFWMPFCPSILDTCEETYLVNPRGLVAPYMILAFDSTEAAGVDLPAALHPFDRTARPQIVTEESNPRYYKILGKFQEMTGKGALLNTSFNLHGEPIVAGADDVLHTLVNSEIDYVALEDYLVWRKSDGSPEANAPSLQSFDGSEAVR